MTVSSASCRTRSACAAVLLTLTFAMAACSTASSAGPAGPSVPSAADRPATPTTPQGAAMPMDTRTAKLPKGFPSEVPVPDGTVVRANGTGSAAGRGLWTYTVDVPASVPGLAAWYQMVYGAANWDPAKADIGADTAQLTFTKGDGQSLLRITSPRAGVARVEATVNLAVPSAPAN